MYIYKSFCAVSFGGRQDQPPRETGSGPRPPPPPKKKKKKKKGEGEKKIVLCFCFALLCPPPRGAPEERGAAAGGLRAGGADVTVPAHAHGSPPGSLPGLPRAPRHACHRYKARAAISMAERSRVPAGSAAPRPSAAATRGEAAAEEEEEEEEEEEGGGGCCAPWWRCPCGCGLARGRRARRARRCASPCAAPCPGTSPACPTTSTTAPRRTPSWPSSSTRSWWAPAAARSFPSSSAPCTPPSARWSSSTTPSSPAAPSASAPATAASPSCAATTTAGQTAWPATTSPSTTEASASPPRPSSPTCPRVSHPLPRRCPPSIPPEHSPEPRLRCPLFADGKWTDFTQGVLVPDGPPQPECRSRGQERCRCKKTKPTLATYLAKNYSYIIHAKVKSVEKGNCNEITTMVEVKDILKSSMPIPLSQVPLITNSSCQCPPLQPKQDVLIMCYEWRSRLMLLDGCLVEKWKDQLNKRFKRWEQRLQEQKLRMARSKNQNAGRSGRSGPPKPATKNTNPLVSGPKKATKPRNGQKEANAKKV
uniref:Secreted frizzled-related protein 3 n=1 Tax=Anas platyrhynchos platyrhynchos TaxID=8840 RepID=U3IGA9_ANAPP